MVQKKRENVAGKQKPKVGQEQNEQNEQNKASKIASVVIRQDHG